MELLEGRLHEIEEQENYELDKENLRGLQKNINDALFNKIDKIHMKFLDDYGEDLTNDEYYLIRQLVKFIKQNM